MAVIHRVQPDAVRGIRGYVLRPGQPPEASVYPGDEDLLTAHFGAFDDGTLFGAASIFREPPPGSDEVDAWRVRGMSVLPERRGSGFGTLLLRACLDHATEREARFVWCNARAAAASLYAREGFEIGGEAFELPGIGLHYLMRKSLAPHG
ncbi:MAG: GNAT family N-acetyltransferase [Actinomycetota bacterium]